MHTCKHHQDLILLVLPHYPIPRFLHPCNNLFAFPFAPTVCQGYVKPATKSFHWADVCGQMKGHAASSGLQGEKRKMARGKGETGPKSENGRAKSSCVWATFSTRTVVNFWSAQPLGQFNFDFPFIQWLRKSRVQSKKKEKTTKPVQRKSVKNRGKLLSDGSGHRRKRKRQMQESRK